MATQPFCVHRLLGSRPCAQVARLCEVHVLLVHHRDGRHVPASVLEVVHSAVVLYEMRTGRSLIISSRLLSISEL